MGQPQDTCHPCPRNHPGHPINPKTAARVKSPARWCAVGCPKRVDDVPTIQLADRNKIQRCHEEPKPRRKGDRMKNDIVAFRGRSSTIHVKNCSNNGSPSRKPKKP